MVPIFPQLCYAGAGSHCFVPHQLADFDGHILLLSVATSGSQMSKTPAAAHQAGTGGRIKGACQVLLAHEVPKQVASNSSQEYLKGY